MEREVPSIFVGLVLGLLTYSDGEIGRVKKKVVRTPLSLSTQIDPPLATTMPLAM